MTLSFNRSGQPVRVPVSTTSAANEVPVTLPPNAKTFCFWNPTNFDVRLEGTLSGQTFAPVTETTGWPVPARSWIGPLRTKNPVKVSAAIFATPGVPLTQAPADGQFIELIYGEGE
jgi:hypothetical protein